MADVISKIFSMLGEAVLLPCPLGSKGIHFSEWQGLTLEDVHNPDLTLKLWRGDAPNRELAREWKYADDLRDTVERGGNLSVLLRDGLCAIDIDHDDEIEPFLKLNPALRKTVISRGAHGVQIWVRCEADADMGFHGLASWPKMYPLKTAGAKLVKDGKETDSWGEWRANNVKSTIWGVHPDGMRYEWLSEGPVVSLHFRDIVWPAHLILPWDSEVVLGLVKRWGPPWTVGAHDTALDGQIETVTEAFWAAWVALHHQLLFEAGEERFYLYDASRGIWQRRLDEEVKALVADEFMAASRNPALQALAYGGSSGSGPSWQRLDVGAMVALQTNRARCNARLEAITALLKGLLARRHVFDRTVGIVHCANTMIDLRPVVDGGDPKLMPFSPRWYSRNQIPVPFQMGKLAKELVTRLLVPGYTADEILMIQRWVGQCVLGRNKQQVFMIIAGLAGGGKSTIMKLFQTFIGEENVMELRTKQLDERFEMSFYVGRTFLAGVDVDGDFLRFSSASALKKLTGDDLLHAEAKGAKDALEFRGNFNIGITCNSRLKVRLKSDHGAWRRRLCIVNCRAPRPAELIEEMEKWLLKIEGPGILNWALSGAIDVLRGLPIRHAASLDKAVDDLINESDSVKVFCSELLRRERGSGIPNKIIYGRYIDFCEARDWEALAENEFARALRPVMSELFSASLSSSVKDSETGKECKGYRGVAFIDLQSAPIGAVHNDTAAADDGEAF